MGIPNMQTIKISNKTVFVQYFTTLAKTKTRDEIAKDLGVHRVAVDRALWTLGLKEVNSDVEDSLDGVNPTPGEIERMCEEFRSKWSENEHRTRAGYDRVPEWQLQSYAYDGRDVSFSCTQH